MNISRIIKSIPVKTMQVILITALLAVGANSVAAKEKNSSRIMEQSKGSITFIVDKDLPKPKTVLNKYDSDVIAWNIIRKENISVEQQHVVKTSFDQEKMIYLGADNLYKCIVQAYADHRPLVLSPDIVWLIICQGFANYVNAHPEEMRNQLVFHEEKMDIKVISNNYVTSYDEDWEKMLEKISSAVSENTRNDVVTLLTADFSTTGITERIASQITVMETLKPYFNYEEISFLCGIPYITLKGTPEDWEKVLEKTRGLSKYKAMENWTKELEPILAEFVKAAKGEPDKDFWQDMVKKRRVRKLKSYRYGCGTIISTKLDGWFLKFFLSENGTIPEKVNWNYNMPSEMVRVGFKRVVINPFTNEKEGPIPMELFAGFVGVMEDPATHALTPRIGWLTRVQDEAMEQKKKESK